MKYDIFISYRREGGYDTAKHLYDLLVRDGYNVSFDIDTLRSGDFDEQLLNRIDECEDFILIVDAHAFDRTIDPHFDPKKDWLRCELAYALKKNKNIIPIFLSDVTGFSNNLPKDVAEVVKKNGPEYNKFYFNDFYRTLKKRFLHSKTKQLKYVVVVVAVVLLGLLLLAILLRNNKTNVNEKFGQFMASDSIVIDDTKPNDDTYDVAPPPKYTKAKISVDTSNYFDDELLNYGFAEKPYIGYVISSEENGDEIVVTMQDAETRVRNKFYISTDRMCNADLSWLPFILVEGNKVKIDYYYEGSGGFRNVISMENIPR